MYMQMPSQVRPSTATRAKTDGGGEARGEGAGEGENSQRGPGKLDYGHHPSPGLWQRDEEGKWAAEGRGKKGIFYVSGTDSILIYNVQLHN